jgi:GH43 family beta-xylosidase
LNLSWAKCTDGSWCAFDTVDLSSIRAYGVYVIWRASNTPASPSAVVYVGQGQIAQRLAEHRSDPGLFRYGPRLFVTWAEVAPVFSGGVEVYLARQLRPLEAARLPLAMAVEVNLPLSA